MIPDISIIHPSRNRPAQALETIKKWVSSAKNIDNIEYILSIDATDQLLGSYKQIEGVKIIVNDNNNAIEAINHAVKFSSGNLIIVVSDDFCKCPFHWDEALLKMLSGKKDFIVKTDDGLQPWIITLPIMDREYYNRFKYVYHPLYHHMFCDTEMTHVADLLERKIILPIRFEHCHYSTGRTERDSVNVKNDNTWQQGEALYIERLKRDFDLKGFKGILKCDAHHLNWLRAKGLIFQEV